MSAFTLRKIGGWLIIVGLIVIGFAFVKKALSFIGTIGLVIFALGYMLYDRKS